MLRYVYDLLPAKWRAAAKHVTGAAGHRRHLLDPLRARHLAKTRKRLSVVEPKLDRRLALAGINDLTDARCMEFGCGLVPTELAYFWLRGCRDLIAVDYNRIARLRYMHLALAGDPRFRDFSPNVIDYYAPFDMSRERIRDVDFIHSESVLEHIAPKDVPAVLRNLCACLSSGGVMIHSIDLRDHLDLEKNPHRFLDDPTYSADLHHDARGNRIRRQGWIASFKETGMTVECHREEVTPGRPLPADTDEDRLAMFAVIIAKKR